MPPAAGPAAVSTVTLGANQRVTGIRDPIVISGQFAVGKWKLEPLAPSTCGQRDVTTFARV